MSAQDAQKEVVSNLVAYAKGGPDAAAAKEQVINIMAAQQHTNHDEAAKRFDNTQAKLQQVQEPQQDVFLTGLHSPCGIALVGDQLFVADTDAIRIYAYHAGQTHTDDPGHVRFRSVCAAYRPPALIALRVGKI
jgi:glucose/arabinose dehydrogenase